MNQGKKALLLIALFVAGLLRLSAQQVDTVSVYSSSMRREVKNVVIVPDRYTTDRQVRYPVVYLLHGYDGNHHTWLRLQPRLPQLASRYGFIIVCPDGRNSWYWDSPLDSSVRYETYIASELVAYVDKTYRTLPDKSGRAITGLSMGGHGGLWIGFRHSGTFGACGSTSGGVDIRPFPANWEMSAALGDYRTNKQRWDNHTVMTQLHRIRSGSPAIIIDCGMDDFFFAVNQRLHRQLVYHRIRHDYIVRPGGHSNAYWKNSILYQLQFFHQFFENGHSDKP